MRAAANEIESLTAFSDSRRETYAEAMTRIAHLHQRLLEIIDDEFAKIASILQPSFAVEPVRDLTVEIQPPGRTCLTSRQRQVLDLLIQGKSNKEIARTLSLGEGTVKIHMAALFRNLGVANRARAAVVGVSFIRPSSSVAVSELSSPVTENTQ
jgi:DNA-binding NarL/FixJ family response regulator